MILLPPSFLGRVQTRVTEFLATSRISGLPGVSVTQREHEQKLRKVNKINKKRLLLGAGSKHTNGCSGSDKVGLLAWFALACTVDGGHSKGVFQALNEASTWVLSGADNCVIGLHPQQAVPLLTFNVVTCNGTASVTLCLIPGYEHAVLVGLVDAAVEGLAGDILRKQNRQIDVKKRSTLDKGLYLNQGLHLENISFKPTEGELGNHPVRLNGV